MGFETNAPPRRVALAAVGALLVLAAGARLMLGPDLTMEALLLRADAWREAWWAIPVYAVAYLGATALLMPAIAFHVVAGVVWGFKHGWLVAWLTGNLACHVQFFAGRWLGPERVKAWLLQRGWVRLVAELEHRGATTMMVARQIPLPFVGLNVAAGASPMTWPQFAFGNAVGLLPSVLVYSLLAASLAHGSDGAEREALTWLAAAAAGVIVMALVTRRLTRSREESSSAPQAPKVV